MSASAAPLNKPAILSDASEFRPAMNGTTTPPTEEEENVEDAFKSLKLSASRDGPRGPHHDIAPSTHTKSERARTAIALDQSLQHSRAARPALPNGTLSTVNGLTTPQMSRPATPYTMNPPVDFDGLSWPSVGTKARLEASPAEAQQRLDNLSGA